MKNPKRTIFQNSTIFYLLVTLEAPLTTWLAPQKMFPCFNEFQTLFFQQLKCLITSDTIFEKIAPCKTIIIQFLSVKIIKYGIYENLRFWKRHLVRRYFNFEVILWMALFRDAIGLIQKSFSTSLNTLKVKTINSASHIVKK